MKAVELLEKYPEAAKVIHEFYRNRMMSSMETDDVPDEFKEMLKQQSFDNEYIATFVDASPRMLFDVFDENGIYITTHVAAADGYFKWEIHSEAEVYETSEYLNNRKMAEAAAVEKAFEILNEQLCQTK
jgi:hypothetical protein